MSEQSRFEITVAPGHVVVWQSGRLASLDEARALQKAVRSRCLRAGVRRALFDNRQTLAPEEAIRDLIWAWVRDPADFERVALLLESSMGVVRANMTAVSQKVRLRAFTSFEEARQWLLL
jgi:hypothetical protein